MKDKEEMPIYQHDNIDKKNGDVDKKAPKNSDKSDKLVNLIAQIVFENLLLKYRGKYSEVSFKKASETPERLKNK